MFSDQLDLHQKQKLSNIPFWFWQRTQFDDMFQKLEHWLETNNGIYPSNTAVKKSLEYQLYMWCCTQRSKYRNKDLCDMKIKRISELKNWKWQIYSENIFYDTFEKLEKWMQENHGKYPSCYADKNSVERKLYNWCCTQRKEYKNKNLCSEKIGCLSKLANWKWSPDLEKNFYNTFGKLQQWVQLHKMLPKKSGDMVEKNLYVWCSSKKKEYTKNKLSPKYAKSLESISGWTWHFFDDSFDDMFNLLCAWIRNTNKMPSQHSKNLEEKKLGLWCNSRKGEFRKNKLAEYKIKMLSEISIWTWFNEDRFEKMYDAVFKWVQINNRLPIRYSKNIEEKKLGDWCANKRFEYSVGKLNDEKINKLLKLKGWYFPERK